MTDGITEVIQLVLEKLPGFLSSLQDVAPWIMIAAVAGILVKWVLIPLILALKGKS